MPAMSCPRRARPASGVEAINETISCGGVRVRPGDIIVADGTGVLCIPRGTRSRESRRWRTRYAADDDQAVKELEKGLSFREALAKFAKI